MNSIIEIDDERLACTTLGDPSNEPILFVHGLMSHRGIWMRTMQHLQEHFYCIAVDLLGFGESDKPMGGDYSIQAQSDRVLQIANHFNLQKFSLVGHSMGVQISLYLASELAPERVKQLVSVGGVSTGTLSKRATNLNMRLVEWARNAPWLYRLVLSLSRSPWLAQWGFKIWYFEPASIPPEAWQVDREKALNPLGAMPSYLAWKSLSQTNLRAHLPKVKAHTLVIHGLQDGTSPIVNATLVKSRVPDAKLILIDECGHFPMYEQFDTYIHYLEEFLE